MERNRVRRVSLWCLTFIAFSVASSFAQGPSDVLVYPRFKLDQKFKTIGRITNTGSITEVVLLFICPGDSEGFCPSLRTTFELERDATRVFNVGDLDPPCKEGYFIAVSDSGDDLIGSFEIFKGKVGKLRESDNAFALGFQFGRLLASDVRGAAGQDGSFLALMDIEAAAILFRDASEPVFPQPVEITGISGDGDVTFTLTREFTCYQRVKLDQLNGNFRRQNLGEYGSIMVRALEREDERSSFIMGAMGEVGKGSQTMRPVFDAEPIENGEVE